MALRVAVTGATGFIGNAVVPLLLQAGYDVSVLVRKPYTPASNSVRVVRGALDDADALASVTQDCDVVLHLAGIVSGLRRNDFMQANVQGTKLLAEAARNNKVKRFVYVSSLAAREPLLNDYAASKAAAESALDEYCDDFEIVKLRPSAVYGPGDSATLPLLQALLSSVAIIPSTEQSRFGMVHVNDIALAIVEAVASSETGTFDVDDGSGGYDWADLIAITRKHFERPERVIYLPRRVAMVAGTIGSALGKMRGRTTMVNSGQLRQLYHPDWVSHDRRWPMARAIPLHVGLPETISWYQAKGMLPHSATADRRQPNTSKRIPHD